jgi:signal peptidase II
MTTLICLLLIAALTAFDQMIKFFIERDLRPISYAPVIDKVVDLRYLQNTGAAFGSFGTKTVLLSVFTAIVLLVGIYLIVAKKIKSKYYLACAVMIIAGGLGNLIDRIFRGYVIDYIEVQFTNFAIFNFADMLVTVGAFMVIIYLIVDIIRDKNKKPSGEKSE